MTTDLFVVDSSVWIQILPSSARDSGLRERVDHLLAHDQVAIAGIVRVELLAGCRDEIAYNRLREFLGSLIQVPITDSTWDAAAMLGFTMRRHGKPVPPTDLLVAATAMTGDATLIHRDRHFDLIAMHTDLRVESHLPNT